MTKVDFYKKIVQCAADDDDYIDMFDAIKKDIPKFPETAHAEKYFQGIIDDDEEMTVKIGISEFIRAEYGDIVRVVLSKPEDDSEFQMDAGEGESQNDDDAPPTLLSRGDELGVDDLMITIRTSEDRVLINAPFPCKIVELNGDVEDNPDLVNEEAYQDGWCMIVQPHDWDEDMYLDQSEYIDYLIEI